MPRPKRDEILRHDKSDEVFVDYHDKNPFEPEPERKSTVVTAPRKKITGKGKRTLEDMMLSMPNDLAQSLYALERIASLEDQIVKVLELCSPSARELVLKQRPTLVRYAPDE